MSVKGEFTCQIMSSLRTAKPSTPTPPAHSPETASAYVATQNPEQSIPRIPPWTLFTNA